MNRKYGERIHEHELQQAREFLKNDPRGKRFQAAEFALILLMKNELPRLKRLIFNASFDLRRVVNQSAFEKAINGEQKLTALLKQTKTTAYAKIDFKKDLQFILFYGSDLNKNEAALYSDAFGRVIATTYASLGIDMNSSSPSEVLESLPEPKIKKKV